MSLPFPTPASLPAAFSISRCTAADVNEIAEIYYVAFAIDPRNTYWWSADKAAMMVWMKRRIRTKMADRSTRHFKVTDIESGDIVAFSRWDIPEGHEAAFGEWIDDGAEAGDVGVLQTAAAVTTTPPTIDIPEGARPELCRDFFDALGNMAEKRNAKTMLGLSLLCTSPKYHRRGAAKALMLPMFALADARGLKVYLEATPDGRPVYEKLGFREVDHLTFDLKELTAASEEVYRLSIMVREPNAV
ncbi:acyl-CoA N-acyltransferase [Annulohypoxylon bovei var. microspora]|nr:acyl-CoA N-acyltransferase [Annulohypoxylon bovei var. microspora]